MLAIVGGARVLDGRRPRHSAPFIFFLVTVIINKDVVLVGLIYYCLYYLNECNDCGCYTFRLPLFLVVDATYTLGYIYYYYPQTPSKKQRVFK